MLCSWMHGRDQFGAALVKVPEVYTARLRSAPSACPLATVRGQI
jgi:hypothetical protein